MDPERWSAIKAIFQLAVELPKQERVAFLERKCGEDTELRAEVLSLLETDLEGTEFLEILHEPLSQPTSSAAAMPSFDSDRYRILQKIGEGGMGEVYEAEQTQPVRRRVALKVIKRGMDTREVIARFETEKQALALMSHRSIARVFDAGSTAQGRPFFAMEFVEGIPITDYCDRFRLGPKDRIQLFREVCSAVQHAHQKGVIHRDLKPSNILVKIEGGDAVPKVIDFGVSKAIAQRLTEKTLFTQLGHWVGTPEYMSPEQADMTGLDVDSRTDVYALGVVLYELLVGAKPFDLASLRRAGFDEIRRVIREEDPPKPSTRVSSLGDESSTAARNRRVDATSLRRALQGDLDAIAMKALEKDRTRRYGSPTELGDDLARYLENLPVHASPPSSVYRARKFIRRHKLGVTAAMVVLTAIVASSIVALWQARIANDERDRAERRFSDVRQLANTLIFDVHDAISLLPGATRARELVVGEALEYLDTLASEARDDRTLQLELAQAYIKIGDVQGLSHQGNLGTFEGAAVSYDKGLAILTGLRKGRPDDIELAVLTVQTHLHLGINYGMTRSAEASLAESGRAHKILEPLLARYPADAELLRSLVLTNEQIATIRFEQGDFGTALDHYLRNLEIELKMLSSRPTDFALRHDVLLSRALIAQVAEAMGRNAESMEQLQAALELSEALKREAPDNARVLRETAVLYREVGKSLVAVGELDSGLEHMARAEEELIALSESDPANQLLVEDLLMVAHQRGRVRDMSGQPLLALGDYEVALDRSARLAPEISQGYEMQSYLLRIYLHRGEALEALSRTSEAADSFDAAIQIGAEFAKSDPTRALGSRDLAVAHMRAAAGLVAQPGFERCRLARSRLARGEEIRLHLDTLGAPVGWPDASEAASLRQAIESCS